MCGGRSETGEHEVPNAQDAEARDDWGGDAGATEHEKEDLTDIVESLEVAEIRVAAEDLLYEGAEFCLSPAKLIVGLVWIKTLVSRKRRHEFAGAA